MKLRVGLVGVGNAWEISHRPALRALSDRFEVRAVYEQVAHHARSVAAEFGCTPVDGFRALAARKDIDAVLVLSKHWYGTLPIFAACDAGKAVYCTTGLGLDPSQAEQLRQRVVQSGVAFMAELPRRHAPATVRLKELLATRLGPPRLLFCHYRVPSKKLTPQQQFREPEHPLVDMIELVDWCRYVAGCEPTSVVGLRHDSPQGSDQEDYQMMSLDFSADGRVGSGPMAQISCGRYMPAAWQEAITFRPPAALQVACENGIAFVDLPTTLVWFDTAGRHQESLESERPVGELLLSQFYRDVTSLVRSTNNLQDCFRALDITLKAQQSNHGGQRVEL